MVVLGNCCINLCPEKCILSQLPITFQKMPIQQILNGNIFFQIYPQLTLVVLETPLGLNKSVLENPIRIFFYGLAYQTKRQELFRWNKGRHGTDPWPTPQCLDIFPTPQRLQNMLFIAYSGARPSARLGHVCSRLFSQMVSQSRPEWAAT